MTEKMIPLSVVDALIEKLEIEQDLPDKTGYDQDAYQFAMKTLEEIKKEAIPSSLRVGKAVYIVQMSFRL